jgi:hypothetical protein
MHRNVFEKAPTKRSIADGSGLAHQSAVRARQPFRRPRVMQACQSPVASPFSTGLLHRCKFVDVVCAVEHGFEGGQRGRRISTGQVNFGKASKCVADEHSARHCHRMHVGKGLPRQFQLAQSKLRASDRPQGHRLLVRRTGRDRNVQSELRLDQRLSGIPPKQCNFGQRYVYPALAVPLSDGEHQGECCIQRLLASPIASFKRSPSSLLKLR